MIDKTIWKTESKFLTWLRGGFRRIWNKHPVKLNFKKSKRFRAINPKTGREAYFIKCEICTKAFRENLIDVDHKIPMPKLTMTNWQEFLIRLLLVGSKDLQCVCKPCHKIKSHADRKGINFQQAKADKVAIKYTKSSDVAKTYCNKNGIEYENLSQARKAIYKHNLGVCKDDR